MAEKASHPLCEWKLTLQIILQQLKLILKFTCQIFYQIDLLQTGCFLQGGRHAGNLISGQIGSPPFDGVGFFSDFRKIQTEKSLANGSDLGPDFYGKFLQNAI
jgi:hypothetical protein